MTQTPDWHVHMYDGEFADRTIHSSQFLSLAEREVASLVQTLALPEGSSVLDVPCGSGRHAKIFAKLGFQVTALDINPLLIEKARQYCGDLQVHLKCQSMADLSAFYQQFDVVAHLFSSFGYFATDEDNAAVMKELAACLKPGGTLVVHSIDREWLMSVFQPVSWSETDTHFSMEARKFDPTTNYNEVNEIRLDKKSHMAERTYYRMRLYDSDEMKKLMTDAGLGHVNIFGSFDGSPFVRGTSSHPVFTGRRL